MSEVSPNPTRTIRRITWIGLVVNLLLAAVKLAAGIFGQSRVLIADALHSFTDLTTDIAILVGSRYWDRPADRKHPYGHGKIESLVTLIIGMILLFLALNLVHESAFSLYDLFEGKRIPAPGMSALLAAVFSIVVKECLCRATLRAARKANSSAVAANAVHHRSDALSSIPAAISVGACIVFGERWSFLDPVGTIVVACMILYSVRDIIRDPMRTLLDQGEAEDILDRIERIAEKIPEIREIHNIRTRPLGGGHFAADLNIHVDPQMPVLKAHALSHRLSKEIQMQIHGIVDVVVHIEPEKMNQ